MLLNALIASEVLVQLSYFLMTLQEQGNPALLRQSKHFLFNVIYIQKQSVALQAVNFLVINNNNYPSTARLKVLYIHVHAVLDRNIDIILWRVGMTFCTQTHMYIRHAYTMKYLKKKAKPPTPHKKAKPTVISHIQRERYAGAERYKPMTHKL